MIDYKRKLDSRRFRRWLLSKFCFVPDKTMLRLQYYIKTGRRIHLDNPQRYTEKIQWYKLYYRNPLLPSLVDKYDVRTYIERKGLGDILTKCYGVYSDLNEINWDELPNKFVAKDTLGGGSLTVLIAKNKEELDFNQTRVLFERWINTKPHVKGDGREWPYYSGKRHRVIIEELIESECGLTDYKFFCFKGKISCIYVIGNREIGGHGELAIMDNNFRRLPVQSKTQARMNNTPAIPQNFEKMKYVAQELSKDFPHVRVDLYNVDGKIYFGELTFYGASGYQQFVPDGFDFELGEQFVLEKYSK